MVISAWKKTKTDDGKTLTFAAGTQSSLVATESERVRSGVAPTGRSMSLNKPGLERRCTSSSGRAVDEVDRPGIVWEHTGCSFNNNIIGMVFYNVEGTVLRQF